MKSFTAKEFSRCPAKVYEAAREDGSVEIAHDRFNGKFSLNYSSPFIESICQSLSKSGDAAMVANTDGSVRALEGDEYKKGGLEQLLDLNKKAPDISALTGANGVDAHLEARKVFYGEEKSPQIKYEDGIKFFSRGFMCRVIEKSSNFLYESISRESKVGDIAYTNGYKVLLIEKATD